MSDLNDIFNREISLEELEGVNGGTAGEWHVLDVVFNGADMWDAPDLNARGRSQLEQKIKELTGFKIHYGFYDLKADIVIKAPDGTLMDLYEFLDHIKANYTMDEILAWQKL